jgi:hypothetical protein
MGPCGILFVSTQPIHAEESPAFEKIRDVSPGGHFALRISCCCEPEDHDNIDPNDHGRRTRFAAVENPRASNHVKEKRPSNE